MPRIRLSRPALADMAHLLAVSLERWGSNGRQRYAAALGAGFRELSSDPTGPLTRDRGDLGPGIRSLHLRTVRTAVRSVARPVHVVFYRTAGPSTTEVIRILHERMDPESHLPR